MQPLGKPWTFGRCCQVCWLSVIEYHFLFLLQYTVVFFKEKLTDNILFHCVIVTCFIQSAFSPESPTSCFTVFITVSLEICQLSLVCSRLASSMASSPVPPALSCFLVCHMFSYSLASFNNNDICHKCSLFTTL